MNLNPNDDNDNDDNGNENDDNNITYEEKKNDDNDSNNNTNGICVVVAGATGAVGRYCVYLLVRDPRVSAIYALTRGSAKSADFYGLSVDKGDKINKLKHLTIDYTKNIKAQFSAIKNDDNTFKFDAGISCLGVYTADVKDVDDFINKEYKPNLNVANGASEFGATKWAYLSGQGVYYDENKTTKPWSQAMFSWTKGLIEKDLQKIKQFNRVTTTRPGFIFGRPTSSKQTGFMGTMEKFVNNNLSSVLKTGYAVHRDDISRAMVYTILNDKQKLPFVILENNDIKANAKLYMEELKNLQK